MFTGEVVLIFAKLLKMGLNVVRMNDWMELLEDFDLLSCNELCVRPLEVHIVLCDRWRLQYVRVLD